MGLLAGAAALTLGIGAADAADDSFQNITADWINPNPANPGGTLVDGGASATLTTIRWGTPNPPGGQKSGYDFALASPQPIDVNVPPSVNFVLGTFTHQNWPINSGTSITGVQLQITIGNVVVDGQGQGPLNLLYNFTHFETPNDPGWGNSCAAGGSQPCPDLVTVSFNAQSENFLVNGVEYTVNVLGFNGQSSFLTLEQAATSANLIVQVAARETVVPVPAAMAMFGVGLMGLGFVTRRRSAA
jgi:hypothetical protein